MLKPVIKLGTRSSKLALWQANDIKTKIERIGFIVQIVLIETKGDKVLDKALFKIGSKGVFTEELEEQLLTGKIDIVQHSAKDLQAQLPDGLELIAFTDRELANDVLVSFDNTKTLKSGKNFVVGTSSTRRIAMLKHFYPHIKTVDMRGNLQTRFKKLEEGHADAMILAYAGVHRMDYGHLITEQLDLETFTPAVGQGSIAIECASKLDHHFKDQIRKACNHAKTEACILAERSFLKTLQGGCSIPVFGLATISDLGQISMTGGIVSLDGSKMIKQTTEGTNPIEVGNVLAMNILESGGDKILAEIKANI